MKSQNKETVSMFIREALNNGNVSILPEIIHPDYIYSSPTEKMKGVEELKAFVLSIRSAFTDLAIDINEQLSDGDTVISRITMTGTHLGDFLGLPKTGKRIEIQGVIISHFEDGMIKQEWELLDQLTLIQQLGVAA